MSPRGKTGKRIRFRMGFGLGEDLNGSATFRNRNESPLAVSLFPRLAGTYNGHGWFTAGKRG